MTNTAMGKLQSIEAGLTRWHRRLTRAANAIKRLEAKRRRLLAASAKPKALPAPKAPLALSGPREPEPSPSPAVLPAPAAPAPKALAPPAKADDLEIPGFLRRSSLTEADMQAAQAVADEISERNKLKAKGQAAKRKARDSGETKKMPLSGKAALAAIRG